MMTFPPIMLRWESSFFKRYQHNYGDIALSISRTDSLFEKYPSVPRPWKQNRPLAVRTVYSHVINGIMVIQQKTYITRGREVDQSTILANKPSHA